MGDRRISEPASKLTNISSVNDYYETNVDSQILTSKVHLESGEDYLDLKSRPFSTMTGN